MATGMRNLLRSWDRWAFFGSLGIVASVVLYHALLASPDTLAGETRELAAGLDRSMVRPSPPMPPAVPVRPPFASPGDAQGGGDWVYYTPTRIVVSAVPRSGSTDGNRQPEKAVFEAPVLVTLDAGVGRVTLAWVDADGNTVKPAGYLVERRRADGDGFVRLTPQPVKEKSFVDTSVAPRTTYAYAETAVTEDPRVEGRAGARGAAREVRTADVFQVELVGGQEHADGTYAAVKVRRFHQDRWWEKLYFVKPGQAIGRPERLPAGDRIVEVDFTTGATVTSVEPVVETRRVSEMVVTGRAWIAKLADAEGERVLRSK
jgi:hypothetical protein